MMDNPLFTIALEDGHKPKRPKEPVPRWFWPLTVMTFILGSFIAAAIKTQNIVRRELLPSTSYSGLAEDYLAYKNAMELQQQTIKNLQQQNLVLQKGLVERTPESKELHAQLDQYRFLAGITPVQGPGIVVTLRDSTKRPPTDLPADVTADLTANFIIHDADIQRVINELRAAGAEAFSVNDQRVVSTTAIRCVGPAIQVNEVPLTPPYSIRAIGDPATLAEALALPGGISDLMRQTDPSMISIGKSSSLMLPSYDGSTMFRYCKPVTEVRRSNIGTDTASIDAGYAQEARE
jgi:uncharacterized protein YlxW (UPF0749 family)